MQSMRPRSFTSWKLGAVVNSLPNERLRGGDRAVQGLGQREFSDMYRPMFFLVARDKQRLFHLRGLPLLGSMIASAA